MISTKNSSSLSGNAVQEPHGFTRAAKILAFAGLIMSGLALVALSIALADGDDSAATIIIFVMAGLFVSSIFFGVLSEISFSLQKIVGPQNEVRASFSLAAPRDPEERKKRANREPPYDDY